MRMYRIIFDTREAAIVKLRELKKACPNAIKAYIKEERAESKNPVFVLYWSLQKNEED